MFTYSNATDYAASIAAYDCAARATGATANVAREDAARAEREAEDARVAARKAAAKRALRSPKVAALRSALEELSFRASGKPTETERRGRAILASVAAGEPVPSDVVAVTGAINALFQ